MTLLVIRTFEAYSLTMYVQETCGCNFENLQVETPQGNFPVQKDGSVILMDIAPGTLVSLETDIKGLWCPKYACNHLSGEWTKAQEGSTFKVVCLKKPLPSLPCFINIPKNFGWP